MTTRTSLYAEKVGINIILMMMLITFMVIPISSHKLYREIVSCSLGIRVSYENERSMTFTEVVHDYYDDDYKHDDHLYHRRVLIDWRIKEGMNNRKYTEAAHDEKKKRKGIRKQSRRRTNLYLIIMRVQYKEFCRQKPKWNQGRDLLSLHNISFSFCRGIESKRIQTLLSMSLEGNTT